MIVTLLRRVFCCLLCRKSEKGVKLLVLCGCLSLLFYLQWNNKLLLRRAKIRDAQNEEEIDEALEIEDEILLAQYQKRLQTGDVTPSNMNFVFHNKFPKSASTTLNYILLGLARRNGFNYEKINSGNIANSIQEDAPVIYYVENNFKPPYLLLKHQFWVNFTGRIPYEMRPTYINMIRDPLDWVTSRYYFNRYGWVRDPGCRGEGCSMSREEHEMSLDECVEKKLTLCTRPSPYFPYLCGPSSACYDHRKDLVYKQTRQRILDEYYFVGILDHFEETLRALEVLLPSYFGGAVEILKGEQIQKKMKLTRTKNKKKMNEKTRQYYLNGPLKYEAKLYNFAKKLFKERLDFLGIPITTTTDD